MNLVGFCSTQRYTEFIDSLEPLFAHRVALELEGASLAGQEAFGKRFCWMWIDDTLICSCICALTSLHLEMTIPQNISYLQFWTIKLKYI